MLHLALVLTDTTRYRSQPTQLDLGSKMSRLDHRLGMTQLYPSN